jgi:hypothetical protein
LDTLVHESALSRNTKGERVPRGRKVSVRQFSLNLRKKRQDWSIRFVSLKSFLSVSKPAQASRRERDLDEDGRRQSRIESGLPFLSSFQRVGNRLMGSVRAVKSSVTLFMQIGRRDAMELMPGGKARSYLDFPALIVTGRWATA